MREWALQGGPGTEPEPETGTVFSGTERGTGTRRNRFPGTETGTGTVLSVKLYENTQKKKPSLEEPPEPKTGIARTVPSPNRNRTEPNRGHPGFATPRRCPNLTLPPLQKNFVNIFFVLAWEFCIEKWRGFLVNFFWSPFPTKRSTKTPQKIRGKFGAKFGAKFGTKIRKIRGTFVLRLF